MRHFSDQEFAERRAGLMQELERRGLDGLLCFAQESMYWLTGYDTFGFCFFQCLVVSQQHLVLITRSADRLQANLTSNVKDVVIWVDDDMADPAADLAELLHHRGFSGKNLGIELDTHGLTAANYLRVHRALDAHFNLVDASDLVSRLRLVKSAQELNYVRKAAALADDSLDAALMEIRPGADEGRILGAMQASIFTGGGDYPANEFIIGSGAQALLVRYASGTRKLRAHDQLTLEWAGVFRHYHAAMMRTVIVGTPAPQHLRMHEAAVEALLCCEAMLIPGNSMESVFKTHAATLDNAGLGSCRLNACGYSLGARFSPSWMEQEMFRNGATTILQPGMVMFIHIILVDDETGLAMTTGRTSIVTAAGGKILSRHGLELLCV